MNARHPHHLRHFTRTWLLALVAILAMVGSTIQPATAQVSSSNLLATQFFDAVGGDAPAYLLSINAVLHTPEGTYSGINGPAQFGEEFGASFSNVQFSLQSASSMSDGTVLASFALTGINTGSYHGLDANCAGISVQGVALLDVEVMTVWTEAWTEANDPRLDQPESSTVVVVTEQWVNYEADAIASQIAAFNALDSSYRPTCASQGFDLTGSEPAAAPDGAPTCLSPQECALAY
jgi:hypothetical protein